LLLRPRTKSRKWPPQKKQKKTGETLPAGFGDLFFDFRQQSVQLLFA
jgi:hypothetical protein